MKGVSVIGVPLDLGASKKGASGGPGAIRRTNLIKDIEKLGYEVQDCGDVEIPTPASAGPRKKKHAAAIARVCERLCETVQGCLKKKSIPVVLGGDHSLAMGSISGVAKHFRQKDKKIGLIWMDAHGDMNTPASSPSGNVHGMPLAHVLGMGDQRLANIGGFAGKILSQNTCLVGTRDLDEEEKELVRKSGIRVFSMKEIDRYGMAKVADQAIHQAAEATAGFHVSFDIDVVDPTVAQGVGTPTRGGITYREAHLFMELVADSGWLTSLDITEVNPLEDVHNTTAELASELILSALGKRVF
ncbi:MAG: arginase [Elusimicrobia bacterium]|nr:arginase [Elusimicrobiota bacterium]